MPCGVCCVGVADGVRGVRAGCVCWFVTGAGLVACAALMTAHIARSAWNVLRVVCVWLCEAATPKETQCVS
ncbi:hypothetical protein JOD55_000855 [Arcanobacterium pluranimalium]|nr:hypothetical protein [Arcanobacterium pluranimalium]